MKILTKPCQILLFIYFIFAFGMSFAATDKAGKLHMDKLVSVSGGINQVREYALSHHVSAKNFDTAVQNFRGANRVRLTYFHSPHNNDVYALAFWNMSDDGKTMHWIGRTVFDEKTGDEVFSCSIDKGCKQSKFTF